MPILTDAFIAEAAKSGNQPQFLLELPELNFNFATHDVGLKDDWVIGDGFIIGGGLVVGGAVTPYDPRIAEGGIGLITQSYDTKGRSGRVGNLLISLVNTDAFGAGFAERALDNTLARVLIGYPNLSYTDYALIFTGVVDNAEEAVRLFSLTLLDNSLRFRRDLNVPVGSQYYTGTPISNRGKFIPIILGRQTDIECIQIQGDANGTLAFPAVNSATEVILREVGANFPSTGALIQVGNDNATYTGREIRVINGVSYQVLTGVTGLGGVTEQPGEPVIIREVQDVFLVGYEVAEAQNFRDDDGTIDPSEYTVTLADNGADLPTTIVTFNPGFRPAGKVFCDADGINIVDDPAEILNGDFETGTTANWTTEAGGTSTILTGGAVDGDNYVDMEGVVNDYRRLYQDISTIVGKFYTVRFFYRDNIPTANLLTNGDFTTGDTTGWTLVDDPEFFGAGFEVKFVRNAFRLVFAKLPLPGPYGAGRFQTRTSVLLKRFKYSFYQDIPTTIGVTYRIAGDATLDSWSAGDNPFTGRLAQQGGGGSGGAAVPNNPQFWRIWFQQRIRLAAGPTGGPTDDLNETIESLGPDIKFGSFERDFVASDTTTRITIEVDSQSAWEAPEMQVGPFFVYEAGVERTSESRFEVGDTGDFGSVLGEDLQRIYSWRQQDFTFEALTGTTRISLASQWIGDTAVGSHFDAVQLFDAGRNPADAIAYIIDNFLPEVQRDTESFRIAQQKLSGWQFGAYIPAPGFSEQLLEEMSFQCMSRIRRNDEDLLEIQVLDFSGRPDIEFSELNTFEDGLSVKREPITNIYTKFRVWFGRNTEEQDDHQGFQGSVFANSEATSDPLEDLRVYCQAAENVYRGVHEFVYPANMIRDLDTAHLFLRWIVKVKTNRHFDIKFRTSHRWGLAVNRGDAVLFQHSHVLQGLPYICQVMGTRVSGENVEVSLRTIRLGGFFEPWEDNLSEAEILKFFEPWDS